MTKCALNRNGAPSVEPVHRRLTPSCQPDKDPVLLNAPIVTEGQRLTVDDVEACALAKGTQPLQQNEQARHKSGIRAMNRS